VTLIGPNLAICRSDQWVSVGNSGLVVGKFFDK
jgi:hypothetical protein